jgi:hypothetical protein
VGVVDAIGLGEFVRHLARYLDKLDQLETLEFVAPRMHYVNSDATAYPGIRQRSHVVLVLTCVRYEPADNGRTWVTRTPTRAWL